MDECALGTETCTSVEICLNTIGSFACELIPTAKRICDGNDRYCCRSYKNGPCEVFNGGCRDDDDCIGDLVCGSKYEDSTNKGPKRDCIEQLYSGDLADGRFEELDCCWPPNMP